MSEKPLRWTHKFVSLESPVTLADHQRPALLLAGRSNTRPHRLHTGRHHRKQAKDIVKSHPHLRILINIHRRNIGPLIIGAAQATRREHGGCREHERVGQGIPQFHCSTNPEGLFKGRVTPVNSNILSAFHRRLVRQTVTAANPRYVCIAQSLPETVVREPSSRVGSGTGSLSPVAMLDSAGSISP